MGNSLLIKGNQKMGYGGDVYLFNLPPIETCTPTEWCLRGKEGRPACYALRNNFLLPNVRKGAQDRYGISKEEGFIDRMVSEIQKVGVRFFRLHSSGDLYSEEYVKKIIEIAKQCPDTLFRTTTRRNDLIGIIQELNSLPNMIVRESLDPAQPEPMMGLPFAALDSLKIVNEQDSYKCLNYCPDCRYYCWEHPVNMHFSEH